MVNKKRELASLTTLDIPIKNCLKNFQEAQNYLLEQSNKCVIVPINLNHPERAYVIFAYSKKIHNRS